MTGSQLVRRTESYLKAETRFINALGRIDATDWFNQFGVYDITTDFAFPYSRLAIFVDSCFRHGCLKHSPVRRLRGQWRTKIEKNMAHARSQELQLRAIGWRVMRIWEHELKTEELAIAQAMQAKTMARWLRGGQYAA